jgi:uncharacterized protein
MKKHLIIYHGKCADGFTAAWVARRSLLGNGVHNDYIETHAAGFTKEGRIVPDVDGKHVYILDYAYLPGVMVDIARRAQSLVWLDHHRSNEPVYDALGGDILSPFYDVQTIFDQAHSGAGLAWKFFYPEEPVPKLVSVVEDRDLWRFQYRDTRDIMASIFSYDYTWENWTCLYDDLARDSFPLVCEGVSILRKQEKDIRELLPQVTRELCIGGIRVPAANLPYIFASDASDTMARGVPFSATYFDTPEGRSFSLRSDKNGLDVSRIAQLYGGGGHYHAAGFTVSFASAACFEVEQ